MRIGLLLFDEVDLLDFGGPYEVFLTADRLLRRAGDVRGFEVSSLTLDGEPVAAYGGVGLIPDGNLDSVSDLDVLIVPGAIAITDVAADGALIESIRTAARRVRIMASVCTGAFVLAEAGLLDGRPWTTHFEDIDILADSIGAAGATRGVRWVDSGEVVSSPRKRSTLDPGPTVISASRSRKCRTVVFPPSPAVTWPSPRHDRSSTTGIPITVSPPERPRGRNRRCERIVRIFELTANE